jgi:hypothetical protein
MNLCPSRAPHCGLTRLEKLRIIHRTMVVDLSPSPAVKTKDARGPDSHLQLGCALPQVCAFAAHHETSSVYS